MNDWTSITTPPRIGQRVLLRFYSLGYYEPQGNCFLHDDGEYYQIKPPTLIKAKPTHWKPAGR